MIFLTDERKGWMASIAFHLLLLVLFFAWSTETPLLQIPTEVQISFAAPQIPIEREAVIAPPVPVAQRANPAPVAPRVAQLPPVNRGRRSAPPEPPKSNPPLRRAPLSPATLPPPAAKNQPALRGDTGSTSASSNAAAAANKTAGGGSAQSAGPAAGAGGTGVSPLIEWAGGITRQRIAGSMPGFPDGVNREAQIVARFVVEPDGEIRDIVFLRKGEPRFEERVLAAMRGWRFNRLPAAVEQADQTGKATFYFKLK